MKNSRIHVWQAPPEHLTARRVWKSWTYVPILRVLFLLLFFFSAGVVEMNKAELWWFTQLHLELNYIFLEFAWISSRNGKRHISLYLSPSRLPLPLAHRKNQIIDYAHNLLFKEKLLTFAALKRFHLHALEKTAHSYHHLFVVAY